jgi:hypothetical protein
MYTVLIDTFPRVVLKVFFVVLPYASLLNLENLRCAVSQKKQLNCNFGNFNAAVIKYGPTM